MMKIIQLFVVFCFAFVALYGHPPKYDNNQQNDDFEEENANMQNSGPSPSTLFLGIGASLLNMNSNNDELYLQNLQRPTFFNLSNLPKRYGINYLWDEAENSRKSPRLDAQTKKNTTFNQETNTNVDEYTGMNPSGFYGQNPAEVIGYNEYIGMNPGFNAYTEMSPTGLNGHTDICPNLFGFNGMNPGLNGYTEISPIGFNDNVVISPAGFSGYIDNSTTVVDQNIWHNPWNVVDMQCIADKNPGIMDPNFEGYPQDHIMQNYVEIYPNIPDVGPRSEYSYIHQNSQSLEGYSSLENFQVIGGQESLSDQLNVNLLTENQTQFSLNGEGNIEKQQLVEEKQKEQEEKEEDPYQYLNIPENPEEDEYQNKIGVDHGSKAKMHDQSKKAKQNNGNNEAKKLESFQGRSRKMQEPESIQMKQNKDSELKRFQNKESETIPLTSDLKQKRIKMRNQRNLRESEEIKKDGSELNKERQSREAGRRIHANQNSKFGIQNKKSESEKMMNQNKGSGMENGGKEQDKQKRIESQKTPRLKGMIISELNVEKQNSQKGKGIQKFPKINADLSKIDKMLKYFHLGRIQRRNVLDRLIKADKQSQIKKNINFAAEMIDTAIFGVEMSMLAVPNFSTFSAKFCGFLIQRVLCSLAEFDGSVTEFLSAYIDALLVRLADEAVFKLASIETFLKGVKTFVRKIPINVEHPKLHNLEVYHHYYKGLQWKLATNNCVQTVIHGANKELVQMWTKFQLFVYQFVMESHAFLRIGMEKGVEVMKREKCSKIN